MSDKGVQKVYISDSPVADDTLEYNYVNSDIDDDPGSTTAIETSQPYPTSPKQMLSQPDLSEIDELAKEAEYQRELQSRLQKTSIADRPSSEYSESWDSDSSAKRSNSSRSININLPTATPQSGGDQISIKSPVHTHSNLEWKDPPANPLMVDQANPTNKRGDNVPAKETATPNTHTPTAVAVTPIAQPPILRTNNGNRSAHGNTGMGEQPAVSAVSHQPLYGQQIQAGPQSNTQYVHQTSSPQLDLYSQQYEQLQQQQLEQQQLLVQQHLLQQQEREKQQAHIAENLLLQRNAPIMYMQASQKDNEYYAVTPRNAYHPYIGHQEQNTGTQATVRSPDVDKSPTLGTKGYVAPKPIKPPKNYVEKNKIRAGGQQSAKPGYSQRLIQYKAEKEEMKEWAPGMIIPRKKASSADDIIRAGMREDITSAEDVWSKRAQDLAIAKQGKLAAGGSKTKKKSRTNSELKRFASDSHIWKEGARGVKEDGYLTAYHSTSNNWQNSSQAVHDYSLPGQVSNNMHVVQQSPVYHSSIPVHPAIGHQDVAQTYAMAYPVTPTAEGQYYQHDNGYHAGPPSGGYHHQPRLYNHPAHLGQYSEHPTYNYTGYMNSGRAELTNSEVYEGSPYSSPHPPSGVSLPQAKPVLNPYATVPPISNAVKPTAGHLSNTGSYLLAHQKDKEKAERLQKGPTYKVYTMKDYKKLKLEYKLGGLGPSQDPTELKEKNEKRSKQLQYAKGVVELEKTKPHVSPRRVNEQVQQISGRQLAVEYSKHIPKPKPTVHAHSMPHRSDPSNGVHSESSKIAALKPVERAESGRVSSVDAGTPLIDIDDLKRRHEEERQSAAEIQYKIQQAA